MLSDWLRARKQTRSVDNPPSLTNIADANSAETLLRTAHQHLTQGAYPLAIAGYQAVLRINPQHAVALNFLGSALGGLGQYRKAENCFRRAIDLDPNYPEAHCNLGVVLRARAEPEGAQEALRQALQLRPQFPDALTNLGLALLTLGRINEARPILEQASRLRPRDTTVLMGLADLARMDGRFEDAEAAFKRALQINPNFSEALAGLPLLRKQTAADGAWLGRAEQMLTGPLTPLAEANLRFAIGKYYDDVGRYARAFVNFQRGNELLKSSVTPYDANAHVHFVDDLIRVYSRECVGTHARASQSISKPKPVLVVGMPRSGTSLVEQIIASHRRARGAGELPFWTAVVNEREAAIRQAPLHQALRSNLATAYLQALVSAVGEADWVVDKTPVNADYLGIVHTVLPEARFIYLQRNPIDTCLSCYFQQFSAAMKFTMDLTDLTRYYRQHERLMAHWRRVLPPETLLDVPYAELVADPVLWTRRILEFIGLEWDEGCLHFDTNLRTVATASAWQVRQKIYTTSVDRWHHYQEFIGPLLALRESVA